MADQNSQFMAILTAVGEARLANSQALGIAWNITQLGVGDGNGAEPIPDRLQTTLLNERRRAPLNQLKVDPNNASIIIAEQVIPEDVGGWWIREIGLYDEAGDLVAVANCPPTFKPQLAQGSGRTQVVRLNLLVSSTQSITLKIDPSVVLATRAYCDGKVAEELAKLDHKQSVRAATTANIALNGLQTLDGVVLVAGDRVLVKNQATAKDNGLYIAAAGAWSRAEDANISAEVTPGLVVHVEQGTTMADSRWQLVTDGAIVLGTTALTFQDVTKGFAPLASPILTGDPKAPTPAQFDNDTSLATSEFVQRALGSMSGSVNYAASTTLTAADAGKMVMLKFSGTATLPNLADLPVGTSFLLVNWGTSSITVTAIAGQQVNTGQSAQQSFELQGGTSALITSENSASWVIAGGTAPLPFSPLFDSSLAASGHQKLPSGLIRYWGTVTVPGNTVNHPVTLPTAYQNQNLKVLLTPSLTVVTTLYSLGWMNKTLNGFGITNPNSDSVVVDWETIGF